MLVNQAVLGRIKSKDAGGLCRIPQYYMQLKGISVPTACSFAGWGCDIDMCVCVRVYIYIFIYTYIPSWQVDVNLTGLNMAGLFQVS